MNDGPEILINRKPTQPTRRRKEALMNRFSLKNIHRLLTMGMATLAVAGAAGFKSAHAAGMPRIAGQHFTLNFSADHDLGPRLSLWITGQDAAGRFLGEFRNGLIRTGMPVAGYMTLESSGGWKITFAEVGVPGSSLIPGMAVARRFEGAISEQVSPVDPLKVEFFMTGVWHYQLSVWVQPPTTTRLIPVGPTPVCGTAYYFLID